jgi:hypothetical protein
MVRLHNFPESFSEVTKNVFASNIENEAEKQEIINISLDLINNTNLYQLSFNKEGWNQKIIDVKLLNELNKLDTKKHLNTINPNVSKIINNKIKFTPAFATPEILDKCMVLNEASWNFEFNGERKIPKLAKIIFQSINSPHSLLVKEKYKKLNRSKTVNKALILIRNQKAFTVIDGNHQAIALYEYFRNRPNKDNIKLLIGEITGPAYHKLKNII